MVGVGGPSGQAAVMHVDWIQMVSVVRMMLRVDVIFLVVICYQLHPALRLPKEEIKKNIYNT